METSAFEAFMPHGMCLLWKPDLLLLHVLSDAVIAISYYSIPVALIYFVLKRTDLHFRWIFILFGIFILSCGTTHLLNIWTIWHPDYVVEGLVKLATATVSIATAITLWPLIPHALALPSPDALSRSNALLQKEIQERKRSEAQVRFVNADLEARVEERTHAWREANHRLTQEIEERKQAEVDRQLLEGKYRRLHESMRDAFAQTDMSGRIQEFNRAFQTMLGYSEAQLLGTRYTDITPERWHAAEEKILNEQVFIRGYSEVYEKEYTRSNGEVFPVELRVFLLRDDAGASVSMWAIVRDITDRKRSEEALRHSELMLAEAQRIAQIGSWEVYLGDVEDIKRSAVLWSDELFRIFGYSPRQITASNEVFVQHVPVEEREPLEGAIRSALEQQIPYDLEHRIQRIDGEVRIVRERGELVRDSAGRAHRLLGTVQDITEFKRIEQALQKADRRKDEFLATLAHELRNPLAPLSAALEIMRASGTQNPVEERLRDMMERQVNHLVRLVDDLLEVSRITRGMIQLKKERVDLATVFAHALETSQPLLEAGGHTLTASFPPNLLWLDADPVRIAQVLSNLLNNAAKYMDRGGNIQVAAERRGDQAVVRISDEGIGIAPEHLPHVFDLFSQIDRSLNRSQSGLGIGLALVRRLVEMHGGRIEAHSEGLDKGSEFIVELPLAAPEPERGTEPEAPVPPPFPSACRILVVDDNRDAADTLVLLVEALGAVVRVAYDGAGALEVVPAFNPDVMLLDLGMPGMDGYEVARRIRQLPDGQDIQLIAVTGWGEEKDRQLTRDAGFDHHLVKPVAYSVLRELLASVAQKR